MALVEALLADQTRHLRITAPLGGSSQADAASKVTEMLNNGAALWPGDEPVPPVDMLSVTAGGGGGSITWTAEACGPVAEFPKPASVPGVPHFANGMVRSEDATGIPFGIAGDPGRRCPG